MEHKTKHKLIHFKHDNKVIVTSGNYDYTLKNDDWFLTYNVIRKYKEYLTNGVGYRIIAGLPELPQLDLSNRQIIDGVDKTIEEHLGVIDINIIYPVIYKDFFELSYGEQMQNDENLPKREGFNKAIELTKDKQFTLEDMRDAFRSGEFYGADNGSNGILNENKYIFSLQQPVVYDCVLEIEENQCDGCKAGLPLIGNVHQCKYPTGNMSCQKPKYNTPKLTAGKIKVLSITKTK